MAGLRRALSCMAVVVAAAAAVGLTYNSKVATQKKDCLSANWGAAAVKGNAALVATVPPDVVTSARATSLDASGSFLARSAVETRRIECGNEACVLVIAKGHAGATSIHVQLFADYSSQENALRDPKRVDDNEPLPFLGAALADVTLKLPSRRPSTCLLYTSPSPRDKRQSRMPSSA